MFELTSEEEHRILRSQFGTLKQGDHSKYQPMVITEQGVAMLSSVINSKRAIQVNIRIMRIFSQLRTAIMSEMDIRLEIERIKCSLDNHDKNIELVFQYLDELASCDHHKYVIFALLFPCTPLTQAHLAGF